MASREGSLSVQRAVETIERAQGYEEPLRRRTEGVTWMVWGLATASVLFSGSAFEAMCGGYRNCAPWIDYIWVPWLAVAIAMTKAVWHIAAVSVPKVGPGPRRTALSVAAVIVVVGLTYALAYTIAPNAPESAFVFFGLGAPWLVLGAVNIHRATPVGRGVMLVVGAGMFLAGLLWIPHAAGLGHNAGWNEATAWGALLGGGLPFVGGLWQAMRG